MLIYTSLYPNADGRQNDFDLVGEDLALITTNHARYTNACFARLEQHGFFLGNAGFICVSMFLSADTLFTDDDAHLLTPLKEACKKHLHAPVYYIYTVDGHIRMLLCFPRLRESSENAAEPSRSPRSEDDAASYKDMPSSREITSDTLSSFRKITDELADIYLGLHFIVGDLLFGEHSIFISFNSLRHSEEFYYFKETSPTVIENRLDDILQKGFIKNLDTYRTLSSAVAKKIADTECNIRELGHALKKEILQNCTTSMESLHVHIRVFILTLTEELTTSGIVNSAFIESRDINRRIMRFETESDLTDLLCTLLDELHRQYMTLNAIGKRGRILTVREYIHDNIADPNLTLAQVAAKFSVKPSLLTHQFREYLGVTLYHYIQTERLNLAQELLSHHPEQTMEEIAKKAGYSDLTTMYRAFKKFDGVTPGYYKNTIHSDE